MTNTDQTFDLARRIRTEQDALEYIAANRPGVEVRGNETLGLVVVKSASCHRCGGTGIYSHFHGRCYACGGADTRGAERFIDPKKYAQREIAKDRKLAREERRREQRAAEKAAAGADWLAANPEVAAALKLDHPILRDMGEKVARFGSLTEKQSAFALKLAAEVAAPKGEVPIGRQEIEGEILSARWRTSAYGTDLKITVALPNGARVWGTCPADLWEGREVEELPGMTIFIRATISASDDDPSIGFFKRPTLL